MDDSNSLPLNGSGAPDDGVPDAVPVDESSWDDLIPEPGAVPSPTRRPRKRLTPQAAKSYRERKERGFLFTLQHTRDENNEPMEALVRRVNFLDKETMGQLPKAVQAKLMALNVERAKAQGSVTRDTLTPQIMLRELHRSREMADAYVCAGFIDPRVYEDKDKAELFGGVWVEDIDVADRMIFSAVCEGSWDDALSVLTPFLDETVPTPEAGETEREVPGETPVPDDPVEDDAEVPALLRVS